MGELDGARGFVDRPGPWADPVDRALELAAVAGRFDEGDLASILGRLDSGDDVTVFVALDHHSTQPGTSACEGFGR